MPFRLSLFPLPAVLFPGTLLPLHIFEPRYRRMLADCLAGDRRFGITPTGREREAPDPGAVGCIAEVRVSQALPDGRSNIIVSGGPRFVVADLVEESLPYYVGLVEGFEDEAGAEPAAERVALLRQRFVRYAALRRELGGVEPEELGLADNAAALSFQIAAALEAEPGTKRRLLAERSAARRVELLLLLLPDLTDAAEAGLRVRRRARIVAIR